MSKNFLYGVSVAALVSLGAGNAFAQVKNDSGVREDTIIVTARKRAESLQDVPFSINAQTEEMLRRTGATSLEEAANNIAGFSVQNLGPGQSQVAIRGVSSGQIARDLPGVKEQVGVYLDESVISLSLFTPEMDFYDLNRLEVLRGPQGTLFGSGSEAGTIRYITNQPNPETYEASAEVTLKSVKDGDVGGDIRGMVNFPISETAALRVVGTYNDLPGYIDAVQPNGSINKDVNDGTRYAIRAALLFEPTANLKITPRVIYQDTSINGFNRVDIFNILANPFTTTRPPVTLGKRQQFTQLQERFEDEFFLVDTKLEYDFGPVSLTSITSFTDRDVLVVRDATQLTGSITGGTIGLSDLITDISSPLFDATHAQVWTEEARLASNSDGPLQWVVGGFYSKIERKYSQTLAVPGFTALSGIPSAGPFAPEDGLFVSFIPYDFKQYAFFGEATLDVTERLHVTGGLRYYDFTEKRTLTFDGIFAAPEFNTPAKTTSNGFSPRAIIAYDATENVQVNAQVSKGFRLGGINDPLNKPLCSAQDLATFGGRDSFNDETIWNYEAGAKSTIFGGKATLNVSGFYTDINNLQATLEAGTCSSRIVFNVPNARSIGGEFELSAHPTDFFDFSVTASYADAEVRSTTTTTSNGVTSVLAGLKKGNRLPSTPKFQAAISGTLTRPVGADMEGYFTSTYQHVGSRFTQIGDQAAGFGAVPLFTNVGNTTVSTFTFDPKLPAYEMVNLRMGLRSGPWDVAVWVNNLFDETARLGLDRERGGRARVGFLTNTPRTVGVTLRSSF
ncbi:MAG: TonB-dependent receptor [Robiginitomaculum sp.]|nr:MAG: TonB-dependent receptor [Robiginitomaculum sp.]